MGDRALTAVCCACGAYVGVGVDRWRGARAHVDVPIRPQMPTSWMHAHDYHRAVSDAQKTKLVIVVPMLKLPERRMPQKHAESRVPHGYRFYVIPGAGARAILCPARAISPEESKEILVNPPQSGALHRSSCGFVKSILFHTGPPAISVRLPVPSSHDT